MPTGDEAVKLHALRDAAREGFAAIDRGAYEEFDDFDELKRYLSELSDRTITTASK